MNRGLTNLTFVRFTATRGNADCKDRVKETGTANGRLPAKGKARLRPSELEGSEDGQGKKPKPARERHCWVHFVNVYDQSTASRWRNESARLRLASVAQWLFGRAA